MVRKFAPFADWTPDQPAFMNQNATVARNVWPQPDGQDRPVLAPEIRITSTFGRPNSLFTAQRRQPLVFSGTLNRLLVQDAAFWRDASRSIGYSTDQNERWQWAQFGSYVVATNYSDPIQFYDLDATAAAPLFGNLAAAAPRARVVASVEPGFLVVGDYQHPDHTSQDGIWWAAIENPASWPAPGTSAASAVQSDLQVFPSGGQVRAIVPAVGGYNAVIFQERAIRTMTYVGGSIVWAFAVVEQDRGVVGPDAVARFGKMTAYLAEDGFFLFDGIESRPIGAGRVNEFFFKDVERNYLSKVRAAHDAFSKCIFFAYPSSGSSSGFLDRLVVYNYASNRWRYIRDQSLVFSVFGVSPKLYVDLDTDINPADIPLDAAGTLDSSTGKPMDIAFLNAEGDLLQLAGAALEATIETGEISDLKQRLWVEGVRPVVDAETFSAAIGARDRQSEAPVWSPGSPVEADGVCPFRIDTRYARARVTIPAGQEWLRAIGVEFEYSGAGYR